MASGSSAKAESFWLVGTAVQTRGIATIEMASQEQCEEEATRWKKQWHGRAHCLVGK